MPIVVHDVGRRARAIASGTGAALAAIRARPADPSGPSLRRILPSLVAVPLTAGGLGVLSVRTGIAGPTTAIGAGAGLTVLAMAGYLARSFEQTDRALRADRADLVRSVDEAVSVLDANRHILDDHRRAEAELSRHATELRLGNGALREANRRLEAALAFKNDLTSMLTHDVAQPISSIASLCELLTADWDDLPDDIRRELATKIDKNTQRLIKMLNDLQLLFRLDTGSVTARRTPVPLLEVVQTVAAGHPGDAGIEIRIDGQLTALADRGHVTAVVQNLLGNAVAYGRAPVEVGATRSGDAVELVVADRGPGVPAEVVPHLFGRFVRGAGLGLFIVRQLVEANGGTVRYEPAEPRGARLIVTWEAASVRD